MEQAVGAQPFAHRVGEARQFDAVGAHDADAAKLETFGEVEDRRRPAEPRRRRRASVAAVAVAFPPRPGDPLRPMMRSPSSVWSR